MRMGIDVGGTNTDAVMVDGREVVAKVKVPTTADVSGGVLDAVVRLLERARVPVGQIRGVMLGTTHFTNALVERRRLQEVAAVRLALPATAALPPMVDWPRDLRSALGDHGFLVHGGHELDGRRLSPVDAGELRRVAREIGRWGIRSIAITSVFSPVNPEAELEAAAILQEALPGASLSLSHEIGRMGLLERENASILNACLKDLAKTTLGAFRESLAQAGVAAPLYLTQNDGTLMSADRAERSPVSALCSGPTNSMRGAAFLTGLTDAIVVDIGGTTTDVGALRRGLPREASMTMQVAGVRCNFRRLPGHGRRRRPLYRPADARARDGRRAPRGDRPPRGGGRRRSGDPHGDDGGTDLPHREDTSRRRDSALAAPAGGVPRRPGDVHDARRGGRDERDRAAPRGSAARAACRGRRWMGRAFPNLYQDTFHLHGVPGTPMAITDEHGDTVILTACDDFRKEWIARGITMRMGGCAHTAEYAMDGPAVRRSAIGGTLSVCLAIGKAIRQANEQHSDPFDRLVGALRETPYRHGRVLWTGKVIEVYRRTTEGFARGWVQLRDTEGSGETLDVLIQNENLVARTGTRVLCSVPDLLCILDRETAEPITTEALRYGQQVKVVGVATPPILRTPEALEVFGPRAFGVDLDFVPVEETAP